MGQQGRLYAVACKKYRKMGRFAYLAHAGLPAAGRLTPRKAGAVYMKFMKRGIK